MHVCEGWLSVCEGLGVRVREEIGFECMFVGVECVCVGGS